jgi:hypothetical protein
MVRVISAKEYQEYAAECLEWAKTAKGDHERDLFLEMAKTWMEAALLAKDRDAPSPRESARPTTNTDDNATA